MTPGDRFSWSAGSPFWHGPTYPVPFVAGPETTTQEVHRPAQPDDYQEASMARGEQGPVAHPSGGQTVASVDPGGSVQVYINEGTRFFRFLKYAALIAANVLMWTLIALGLLAGGAAWNAISDLTDYDGTPNVSTVEERDGVDLIPQPCPSPYEHLVC